MPVAGVTLIAMLGVFGCADSGAKKPNAAEQATVTGKVANNGKPVTKGSDVVFSCEEKGAIASGRLDEAGKFTLAAGNPSIGIPAGKYKVTVRPADTGAPAAKMDMSSEAYKKQMMGGVAKPPAPTDIPTAIQSLDSTPLTLDVKPGSNTFDDIDLGKFAQ